MPKRKAPTVTTTTTTTTTEETPVVESASNKKQKKETKNNNANNSAQDITEASKSTFTKKSDRLDKLIALCTGGGGYIGRRICLQLALAGASLSFCDLNEEEMNGTTQLLKDHGIPTSRIHSQKVDVTSEKQIQQWVDSVVKKWGTIDVLVNNAAAFVFGKVEDITDEQWNKVFNINVKGYAYTMKYVVPVMKKQKHGSIVNIGSWSSFIAQPEFVPYNTSKGAVLQLTRCTALDLGNWNIRVNLVAPGAVDSPATWNALYMDSSNKGKTKAQLEKEVSEKEFFLKRFASADDVAMSVIFLASNESSYITGSSIALEGGGMAH